MTSSNGLNLISPSFPNEYPNNANCTCVIEPTESNQQSLAIIIDVEVGLKTCFSMNFIVKNLFIIESFI
jgi:hypothetical protein